MNALSTLAEWMLMESLSLAIKVFTTIRNDLSHAP